MAKHKKKVLGPVKDGEIVAIVKPKSPRLNIGRTDPKKNSMAKKSLLAGGMGREAGMMIDGINNTNTSYAPGFVLESYRNSYASGLGYKSGLYDVPSFVTLMNSKNGGIIQWPSSLQERYGWFRWYARCLFLDSKHLGLVLLGDGTEKSIKDIQIGDEVVTGLGTVRKVKWTFQKECEDMAYSIKAISCNPIKTTHHHPFYILKAEKVYKDYNLKTERTGHRFKNIEFKPEWVNAEELKVGDHVLRPINVNLGTKKLETRGGFFKIGEYVAYKITKIESEFTKDTVYNFEVDAEGDEKSYICNGMVTHNTEPLVSRALDLLSDLPMSKLSLHVPKFVPDAMREELKDFFEEQARSLNFFKVGEDILYERNMIGQAYMWSEWDEENCRWSRIQMLPPEEVFPFEIPFSDLKRIEYRPRRLVSMLLGNTGSGVNNEIDQDIVDNVPPEIVEAIQTDGCILLESDPMKGSFCQHIPRRKSPYLDLSASLLDRVLVPLQLKDFYKYTQLSLASRNMTPKYLVIAPNCTPAELDDLRNQWDLSYLDPDYAMVANFEVRVDVIGSRDRLLELASEYERLDNEIFAAMGVTRELLTGEGSYSGSKITVEILHTMFLHERETLINFFEQKLFLPICEKKGWYTVGKNNIKKYWYPRIGFNRLTIRDNSEVFDSLFQMYQKGSLPVEIIYDLFNLDATEIDDKLYADLFTIRDATFNELIRGVLSDAGRGLTESSDIVDKIAKYLNLKYQKKQEGGDGGNDMGGGMPSEQPQPQQPEGSPESAPTLESILSPAILENNNSQEGTQEETAMGETSFDTSDISGKAQEVVDEIPSGATPEEIMQKIVSKEKEWETLSVSERNVLSDMIIKSLPPKASEEEIMKAIILKTGGVL